MHGGRKAGGPRIGAWLLAIVVSHGVLTHAHAQTPLGLPPDVEGPFVSAPVSPGVSPEVRALPMALVDEPAQPAVEINPRQRGDAAPLGIDPEIPDPLVQDAPAAPAVRTPNPFLTFEGIATNGFVPPDTNGDVGPTHYVQMVNTRFAIFNKTGGVLVGPVLINSLWAGQGNQCALNNDGDPVVLYDSLADRWILSQFAVPPPPSIGFHVCIAVSQTPNPTGAYFLYDFPVPAFPDYFKLGVWPDAYYMSTNEGSPPVGIYAFDRARMLAGQAATFQRFVVANRNFMLPADLDGPRLPPAGASNPFYTFMDGGFFGGSDRLEVWHFHVDWVTPANSTFTLADSLPTTPFNYTVCGHFVLNCIPQPAPGETVDPVSEWPMWRLQYRNFETHETLVANFTVDVTGADQAGIRWYEVRRTGAGPWTIFQEGTHAPDAHHRWMGSIAMDGDGNIALGYSVSSLTVLPAIRYATRLAGDPLGTLQAEVTLMPGGGVQTSGFNRWGDYSSMTVDPVDDCTFWYTNEYYASTSAASWRTRIGAFQIPGCSVATFADVPPNHFAFSFIEAIYSAGITAGCGTNPLIYCPGALVTRGPMAVFLLRGIHGGGFTPPPATGTVFADVPASHPFAAWIEQLFAEGITAGCATNPLRYCPGSSVTRGEMAVFLLRAKHGAGFTPPNATGTVFADVPASHPFAAWIEQIFAEGITAGCGTNPLIYCPGALVSRAEMAVFLARAFNLPLP